MEAEKSLKELLRTYFKSKGSLLKLFCSNKLDWIVLGRNYNKMFACVYYRFVFEMAWCDKILNQK